MENYPKVEDILNSNPTQTDLVSLASFMLWVTIPFFIIFCTDKVFVCVLTLSNVIFLIYTVFYLCLNCLNGS